MTYIEEENMQSEKCIYKSTWNLSPVESFRNR